MKSNFSHPSHLGCEDNCVLIFELSNGGHATASIDYCRPLSSPTHGDDWVRIVGTKGVIEANASKSTCNLLVEDRESFEIPLPPFSKMFRNFLLSLISDVKYEIGPSEPFSLTYACLRAKEAAEKQQVLKIEQSLWNFAD
jgi:predicted dehydrogenase